jgi:hypothetical protein
VGVVAQLKPQMTDRWVEWALQRDIANAEVWGSSPRGSHLPGGPIFSLSSDTTDTVLMGIAANWRNYRNCTRRPEPLVTRSNRGYYRASAGFTVTCRYGPKENPSLSASSFKTRRLAVQSVLIAKHPGCIWRTKRRTIRRFLDENSLLPPAK